MCEWEGNKMRGFQGMKCSRCQKKGLAYAGHPHAFGWKDLAVVECRYCKTRFKAEPVLARRAREREAADA